MKRYRILAHDFDARVHWLSEPIRPEWTDEVKKLYEHNRRQIEESLIGEFGAKDYEQRRQNFIDVGHKPLSILAFHNRFLEQARVAFIMGAYYPSMTGACALGERILNHLILKLRDNFKGSPEYKQIYRKDSFDDWSLAIETLHSWEVLLPDVAAEYHTLRNLRNNAIHFRPDVDHNDRALSLQAIKSLSNIVAKQFGGYGQQPWTLSVPGEEYIQKAWESKPFIREIYLPNCELVGPSHIVVSVMPWRIHDDHPYEQRDISDEEFTVLRKAATSGKPPR